jgi:hypothetical protein
LAKKDLNGFGYTSKWGSSERRYFPNISPPRFGGPPADRELKATAKNAPFIGQFGL